jgi:hypothetical protein
MNGGGDRRETAMDGCGRIRLDKQQSTYSAYHNLRKARQVKQTEQVRVI